MTDQQLHDYSADHLYYEISMLYETAMRLVHDPAMQTDWISRNALIESFTIHARALSFFLYKDKQRPDDVTAAEYVNDVDAWCADRGSIPPELQTVIDRTGKEIAHLTTARISPGDPRKAWTPEMIFREFCGPLKRFVGHVPSGRLDISVLSFVAALPTPPTSGAPVPPTAIPPIGASNDTRGDSNTARSTSVSTP